MLVIDLKEKEVEFQISAIIKIINYDYKYINNFTNTYYIKYIIFNSFIFINPKLELLIFPHLGNSI